VRPVDVPSLARRFFSRGEADALQALSGDRQLRSFFRCWTRKESLVKAVGDGLGIPLNAFEAGLQEKGEIVVYPTPADQQTCWTVSDISTFPGYAAALTVAGSGLQIEHGVWRSA